MLKVLVCCRQIDPETNPRFHEDKFRYHREWYLRSAMGNLLGEDDSLAQKDKPYRCLDWLLEHRDEQFWFLKGNGVSCLVRSTMCCCMI